MPSPFEKLTESDKLRSFVETRPFAEELAESNARLFETETRALGLQELKSRIAANDEQAAAEDAFAQNVLVGAKDEADVLAKAQKFAQASPQFSRFMPNLIAEGNKMFDGSNRSKQQQLQMRQQELQLKEMEKTNKLEIQAKNARNELSLINDKEAASKIKAQKLIEGSDPAAAMGEIIDADNPMHVSLYKQFNESYRTAATSDQKEQLKVEYKQMFESLDRFRNVQNSFSASTVNEYGDTMSELRNNPEVEKGYAEWYSSKTPEELDGMDESSIFIRFLADAAVERDRPGSIGYNIKKVSGEAEQLLNRSRKMIEAKEAYNTLAGMRDEKTNSFTPPNPEDVKLAFLRLKKRADDAYSYLETEAKAKQQSLEEQKLKLDITSKENAQSNRMESAAYAADVAEYNSMLRSKLQERATANRAFIEAQGNVGDPEKGPAAQKAVETLPKTIETIDKEIASLRETKPTTEEKPTIKAPN
jgi:hypothetical protein